jgi:hypothetical protein
MFISSLKTVKKIQKIKLKKNTFPRNKRKFRVTSRKLRVITLKFRVNSRKFRVKTREKISPTKMSSMGFRTNKIDQK